MYMTKKKQYLRKNNWTIKANHVCATITSTMARRNCTLTHCDNKTPVKGWSTPRNLGRAWGLPLLTRYLHYANGISLAKASIRLANPTIHQPLTSYA